jgi:ribose transport system permease protein
VSGGIAREMRGDDEGVSRGRVKSLSQEQIVALVAAALFVGFSLLLRNFLSVSNLLGLARSISVLGILALGMAPVVISRGIDLSQVANFAISTGWAIHLMNAGYSTGVALGGGLLIALAVGLFNGLVIAFVEIPALFVTLASGFLIFGIGQAFLLPSTFMTVPAQYSGFLAIGQSRLYGIPSPILIFFGVAVVVYLMLSRTLRPWPIEEGFALLEVCVRVESAGCRDIPAKLEYLLEASVCLRRIKLYNYMY